METVVRVVVIYLVIIAGLRVMGKREFSQLAPTELVLLLLIPELVAQALVREDFSMTNAIVAVSTLFSLVFLTSLLSFHSRFFGRLIQSSPTVLVARGQFQVDAMNRERVSENDVFDRIHQAGLEQLDQVKWAILESDGRISIVPENSQEVVKAEEQIEPV